MDKEKKYPTCPKCGSVKLIALCDVTFGFNLCDMFGKKLKKAWMRKKHFMVMSTNWEYATIACDDCGHIIKSRFDEIPKFLQK